MKHKFAVGQSLELLPSRGSSSRQAGMCKVLALLPFEGNSVQYRVQSTVESHQRIVSEGDLRPKSEEIARLVQTPLLS
jgi:hypothetical protein